MTPAALIRALAYLDARVAIVAAIGWCDVQWWLCKPDGAQ